MKINEIKLLALELEEWAMKDGRKGGWKKIVPLITAHHYGDLLDSLADMGGSGKLNERVSFSVINTCVRTIAGRR